MAAMAIDGPSQSQEPGTTTGSPLGVVGLEVLGPPSPTFPGALAGSSTEPQSPHLLKNRKDSQVPEPQIQTCVASPPQLPFHSRTGHSYRDHLPPPPHTHTHFGTDLWASLPWRSGGQRPGAPGKYPRSEHSAFWKNDPILQARCYPQLSQDPSFPPPIQTMPWAPRRTPCSPPSLIPCTPQCMCTYASPLFQHRHLAVRAGAASSAVTQAFWPPSVHAGCLGNHCRSFEMFRSHSCI